MLKLRRHFESAPAALTWLVTLGTLAGFALGCGGKDSKEKGPSVSVGHHDASVPDAAPEPEVDAYVPRGNTIVDPFGTVLCEYADEDSFAFEAHPRASSVSLAMQGKSIAMAFHGADDTPTLRALSVTGESRDVGVVDGDSPSDIEVVATDEGYALSYWSAGELLLRALDGTGTPMGEAVVLEAGSELSTSDMVYAGGHVYLALAGGAKSSLADYPLEQPDDYARVDLGREAAQLFVLDGEVYVAWSTVDGVQMAKASSLDDAQSLSDQASTQFDVAAGDEYGAVAFAYRAGSAELVRYQSFQRMTDVTPNPRTVQLPPAILRDVSISAFGNGYVVAYRSLVSRDFPTNTVRLVFMTLSGQIVYEGMVAETSRAGGRTDVVTTDDGHLAVAWIDSDNNQAHLQRLYCPVALKLCSVEK